jgi:hypothetical protein
MARARVKARVRVRAKARVQARGRARVQGVVGAEWEGSPPGVQARDP